MTRKSRLNKGMFSSTTDQWATPQAFFDELDHEFQFDLDPCVNALSEIKKKLSMKYAMTNTATLKLFLT